MSSGTTEIELTVNENTGSAARRAVVTVRVAFEAGTVGTASIAVSQAGADGRIFSEAFSDAFC